MDTMLSVFVAFFIVTISPGPANIAVATVAMSHGRFSGIKFGLGLSLGLSIWGVVAATGLGAILQASEIALVVMKIFGGVYLLLLAFQSAQSARGMKQHEAKLASQRNWFIQGLILNVSNPKAVVAWMAALSMGLGTENGIWELVAVTLICMVLGVINYIGHAALFSFPSIMSHYQKFRKLIESVVAGLFAIAGLGLLRSAFSRGD